MSEQTPLYNSRITKIYTQYLRQYYSDIDTDQILKEAEITNYEIEDPAHWFTQDQVDRFHGILVSKTGNPNIARDAGRSATSSEGLGATKQYILGLMSPTAIYLLIQKVYPLMSRGVEIKAEKIGENRVEITCSPTPGVEEKPYQCANRIGTFESVGKFFTDKYASIDHPTCVHNGDENCRYIISWEKTKTRIWKKIRNYFSLFAAISTVVLFFTLPLGIWFVIVLMSALLAAIVSINSERFDKKVLKRTIETQTNSAQDTLLETDIRYNNALLVQEIGQATSKILDTDMLIQTVAGIMEKRLDFKRGMIMMANQDRTHLNYYAGYGHSIEQEDLLRAMEFSLDNPESKGIFVLAMRQQKPFLVNDLREIEGTLSHRSLKLVKQLESQAIICVPIAYEREAMGILAVDNPKTKRPLRQSDMNLLMGVASQLAISIVNAQSFEKLQTSEKKYRDLVENANSIILRLDTGGNIIFFNEFAQRFFGYTEQEILGRNAERFISPSPGLDQLSFDGIITSLRKDPERQLVSESETALRNNQKVWIAWTYKPIFNDSGRFVEILCIGNDVTELKHADQEKKDLQAQLQRAQKMEAIGTLAGGVAHDLNNILSGIVSYPELLLMDLDEDSPLRKPILTIQKSGERAAAIVQDLLTLARRGVETTEVMNLNTIVSEYLLSPEHAKLELNHSNVKLRTQLDPDLLNILGSPVHLSKTVMNLITNAAEAMPDGGNIVVATENRHMDRLINCYDDIDKGDYAILTVTDTGIGISAEDLERIFEPFYTKKAMGRSGTGLGMAVVWGTVKDHRGYIDIQSTEGKGTEIALYFPVTRKTFAKDKELSSFEELKGRGESVLIIDDVKEQREIASGMLEKLGYSVTTASGGEEALAYMQQHSADLLVLDMIMEPGIDGLETYRRILKIHPQQRTIIASGYSESALVKEAQKLGAGPYIKKPYLLEAIGRAVKTELSR